MQYSLAREMKEGRGKSWGAIVAGAAATITAYQQNRASHDAKTAQDRERARLRKAEKRAQNIAAGRVTDSPAGQQTKGLLNNDAASKNESPLNISPVGFAMIGLGLLLIFTMRK
jgi:hypothetical protein